MKPLNDLIGQSFGRLTVIERAPNPGTRKNDTAAYWKCLCKCGKCVIIRGYSLTTGKTQSCGCLKLEAPHLVPFSEPKYPPLEAAARLVWKRKNRYSELPFEFFLKMCQENCFYCGAAPNLKCFAKRKDTQEFTYNTIDRLDSSKGHIIDNVVPACLICNRAKLDRSLEKFQQYIFALIHHQRLIPQEYRDVSMKIDVSLLYDKNNYALIGSIKSAFDIYQNDRPGNLILEQFFQLTQMPCFYCGGEPFNKRNRYDKRSSAYATGTFIYNGLDRIDNALPHYYNNVVPSCKYCNSAKNNLTLDEFYKWVDCLTIKHSRFQP